MPPRVKDAIRRTEFSLGVLRSRTQDSMVVQARHSLCAELHDMGFSYPQIGEWLARHHTTVMYGERRHRARSCS